VLRVSVDDAKFESAPEDDRILCATGPVQFPYLDGGPRNGGYLQVPCAPDGRYVTGRLPESAVRESGIPASDLTLVATKRGVTAYAVNSDVSE
jgi:hypothetical protein